MIKIFVFTLLSSVAFAEERLPHHLLQVQKGAIRAASVPVTVEPTVDGNIAPDKLIDVELTITMLVESSDLIIAVRGINGLEVLGGEAQKISTVGRDQKIKKIIQVKIPHNTQAFAVVDLRLTSAGMQLADSIGIPFRHGKPDRNKDKLGELKKNKNGKNIRVMKAIE